MSPLPDVPPPSRGVLVDLACRTLGGSVMAASDESFGEKEWLVVEAAPVVVPGRYGHKGEIVDGWETRRRRGLPGHDWALIRLGATGVLDTIVVDTTGFTGNFPPRVRVEAALAPAGAGVADLLAEGTSWVEIVPSTWIGGDRLNELDVVWSGRDRPFTHLRLTADPDGGIARLRAMGRVVPDPVRLACADVDLAAADVGGLVVDSSDGFYSSAANLIRPGSPATMGEGWETRRRRDAGHDWAVIRLAAPARLTLAEIDTTWYVANASAEVELWGWPEGGIGWLPLLPRTVLQPDQRRFLPLPGSAMSDGPSTVLSHVRIDAYPDGGLARVRLVGSAVLPEAAPQD
ncbi:MAG: allantoicase [Kineosporiaceae bacterium]